MNISKAEIVSILSTSYSLENNSGSSGGVTNFRHQARTCTGLVHVISRLLSLISRLMFSPVDLYFLYSRLVLATESKVLRFCQSSRLIILYSRVVHILSRLIVD